MCLREEHEFSFFKIVFCPKVGQLKVMVITFRNGKVISIDGGGQETRYRLRALLLVGHHGDHRRRVGRIEDAVGDGADDHINK